MKFTHPYQIKKGSASINPILGEELVGLVYFESFGFIVQLLTIYRHLSLADKQ